MLFKFFDASHVEAFGKEMAELIIHRTPNDPANKNQERLVKKYGKRHEATLALIEKRAVAFKKAHKLNVYAKAKLGTAFKYTLIDNGYDKEFVDGTTTWLMLKV